jgi:hypothetical protein
VIITNSGKEGDFQSFTDRIYSRVEYVTTKAHLVLISTITKFQHTLTDHTKIGHAESTAAAFVPLATITKHFSMTSLGISMGCISGLGLNFISPANAYRPQINQTFHLPELHQASAHIAHFTISIVFSYRCKKDSANQRRRIEL